MNCLNCGQQMVNNLVMSRKQQIAYDICEGCGSLWLDAGELDKMAFQVEGSIEFSSQEPAAGAPEIRKACPRCEGEDLAKVSFVGSDDVVLDRCANCGGFWLDGGELDLVNRELEAIMPVEGHGFSDFINNAHLPYLYERVWRPSSATDFALEVPPIKGAEFDGHADLDCPTCAGRLSRYRAFGIRIEGCRACKGVWLDRDELRRLKDKAQEDPWTELRWMDDEVAAIERTSAMTSRRACPKCPGAKLVSTVFGGSGPIIDWCPQCHGTWLDHGEFREITDLLKARLDELSAVDMREKVYEEIKGIWGGPEGVLSDVLDAKAAISALINITVFEHPMLARLLAGFGQAASGTGL